MLKEHLGPFLAVLVKDHDADARILERPALVLIQPLLQGLVVVRAIDESSSRPVDWQQRARLSLGANPRRTWYERRPQ